jgi:hypothetical protein
MINLDRAVTAAGGTALRYGNFCGDPVDGLVQAVRARKFPTVGLRPTPPSSTPCATPVAGSTRARTTR